MWWASSQISASSPFLVASASGNVSTVRRHLRPYRTGAIPTDVPLPHLTVRRVTNWIMRRPERLTDTERKCLTEQCERSPALATTTDCAQRLATVRERRNEHLALDVWPSTSGLPTSASTASEDSAPWPAASGATEQPSSRP
jgi:hypothetical protein